jgi:putative oxidoreductase
VKTSVEIENTGLFDRCLICAGRRGYGLLAGAASMLQSPLLLGLRLYWGWQFFQTGKGKLMNHEKVTMFFQSLHIPMPSFNAHLAGGTEFLGGLLFLTGFASRLVCLPLLFTLTIAYLTAETAALKVVFSDPDKFVTAAPFLFMLACLVVLAFGPGKFSVDWLLSKKLHAASERPGSKGTISST